MVPQIRSILYPKGKIKSFFSGKVWEWFSEAESAPIRSAVKFYFDIDVRIFFSTSSKNIFSIDQKKSHRKKWKCQNFKKSKIFKDTTQILKFWNFRFLRFWKFSIFLNFFKLFLLVLQFQLEIDSKRHAIILYYL